MGRSYSQNAFKILTGKPTGNRPLGRPRRRWDDYIRMDLEEIGINVGNWVHSAQDKDCWRALVNAALNLRELIRSYRILQFSKLRLRDNLMMFLFINEELC